MRKLNLKKDICQPLTRLNKDEVQFKNKAKDFAFTYISPCIDAMESNYTLDNSLIKKLFEYGFMNIEIPTEHGGQGESFFKVILAIEEFSKVDPSVSVFIDVQNTLINNAIIKWGTDDQRSMILPGLGKDTVGAFSITEKDSGSDAFAISTKAEKVNNGYILSGEKHWVTNAAEANMFIIFAKVCNSSNHHPDNRITAFIVNKSESEGFTVHKSSRKLGIKASSTCDISLHNVFVPENQVLGEVGRGRHIALNILADGRIGIASQMLGLAEGALQEAVRYSKERNQFGKPISTFQGIHFPLADIATKIESARLFVYNTARIREDTRNFIELLYTTSMAKHFAAEIAEEAASWAINVFGGTGYMERSKVEKFYRDAKIGKIYEGTTNMQLLTIAKTFLKIRL